MHYKIVSEGEEEQGQSTGTEEVKVGVERHGHTPEGRRLREFVSEPRTPLVDFDTGSFNELGEEDPGVSIEISTGARAGVYVSITDGETGELREYMIHYTELVNAGLRVWNRDLRALSAFEEANAKAPEEEGS